MTGMKEIGALHNHHRPDLGLSSNELSKDAKNRLTTNGTLRREDVDAVVDVEGVEGEGGVGVLVHEVAGVVEDVGGKSFLRCERCKWVLLRESCGIVVVLKGSIVLNGW